MIVPTRFMAVIASVVLTVPMVAAAQYMSTDTLSAEATPISTTATDTNDNTVSIAEVSSHFRLAQRYMSDPLTEDALPYDLLFPQTRGDLGYRNWLVTSFSKSSPLNPSLYDNSSVQDSAFDFKAFVSHRCFNIVSTLDHAWCEAAFGPYADFRTLLLSGQLGTILVQHGLFTEAETSLIDEVAINVFIAEERDALLDALDRSYANEFYFIGPETRAEVTLKLNEARALWERCAEIHADINDRFVCFDNQYETFPAATAVTRQELLHERAGTIWDECGSMFTQAAERAACYERNQRLFLDFDNLDLQIRGSIY